VVVSPQTTAPETAETPVAPEETVAAPSIVSLDAQAREVEFGDSVRITCQLSGDDDDGLRFSWWCSRGDLVASRTKATWTAPHRAGIYEISVTVTDEQGQSDTRAVEIRVNDTEVDLVAPSDEGEQDNQQDDEPADPATSPEITGLTLTAEHNYLEQSLGGGYSILVSRECTIHCSVANPEELEIEWICTGGGTITGEGDTVTFKAPSMPGYSKVTVTVTNRDGEQDSVTTTIYVSTCTYCF
ncbi:MAG: hypothetical protein JXA58_01500, partial [Dehalococcoidia bacterium]|nr:hypothetical protein [Dehalococcoidia bacterium]